MPAQTIDEVIGELETVIQQCINKQHRAGYFAVLYHRVTCRVKEGILNDEFEDGKRMERLDVLFANRYLNAWYRWGSGQPTSTSWKVAFDTTSQSSAIIMQHLLLGINAHINLDLAIAAVETMKGGVFTQILGDFNFINGILAALIDEVQDSIGKVSPLMLLLDLHARNHDEMLVQFSINVAREGAWRFALELNDKKVPDDQFCINTRDKAIERIASKIANPGRWIGFTLKIIRLLEWRKPGEVIQLLKDI